MTKMSKKSEELASKAAQMSGPELHEITKKRESVLELIDKTLLDYAKFEAQRGFNA